MYPHHLRNGLFLAVLGILLIPASAMADRLIMKNGDTITGDISKIAEDVVHIDPSYADEYTVALAEVVSIEADQTFAIELADGRGMEAQFAGVTDGKQTLIVDENSMTIGIP